MSLAIIKMNIPVKLAMNVDEAANSCGFNRKAEFLKCCPVKPTDLGDGKPRYLTRDLEAWIDSKKAETVMPTDDELLAKLG